MKLRALEPADLDCLYLIENDSEMWTNSETSAPYSRDTLQTYMLTCSNDFFQDRQLRLVIEEEGACIGFADLCNYSPLHNRAEVSIAVIPSFRGKGYGTEALRQLCRYARFHLHLYQVFAIVGTDNTPCNRAFASAGFLHTATMKEWLRRPDGGYADVHCWQCRLEP